ncbi:alpha/beta fold hydrolase [Flavitalea sp.]|nr:alpha/beta hydrolase [Flavitalea sp.]
MAFAKCNGINIYYEVSGEGPPLILISGLGGDHFFWDSSLKILSKHFQVITYDTRGIGKTDAPKTSYSLDIFTDDLIALMDELKIEKAHILGFSMGGNIALTLALKSPGRISKLIIAASHAVINHQIRLFVDAVLNVYESGISTKQMFDLICPWLFSNSFLSNPKNEIYLKYDENEPDQQPLYAWKNQYLAQRNYNVVDSIDKIKLPTLIINGEFDLFATLEDAKLLRDKIEHSVLNVIPQSGHLINYENPELFHKYILDFLID